MTDLRLDWCSYDAAKYAVEHWHYSGTMPSGKTLKIGVWEDNQFIGVVIYSRGATPQIGSPFGLSQTEVCELTRVALDEHNTPVTRILSISRKLLTDKSPDIRLIVSYADPDQNHEGTIYQADNWHYHGQGDDDLYIQYKGEVRHPKSFYSTYGTQSVAKLKEILGPDNVEGVYMPGKRKYVYALGGEMERKVKQMAEPYP